VKVSMGDDKKKKGGVTGRLAFILLTHGLANFQSVEKKNRQQVRAGAVSYATPDGKRTKER